jgi:hypothetical protein
MTDLVAFVRACLDEDERVARAATPGPWRWEEPSGEEWPTYDESLVSDGKMERFSEGDEYPASVLVGWGYDASGIEANQADRDHIARHDPARVLAEVAAKRAILERHHRRDSEDDYPQHWGVDSSCVGCHAGYDEEPWTKDISECPELRDLAQPFAGRPGWREEWRT